MMALAARAYDAPKHIDGSSILDFRKKVQKDTNLGARDVRLADHVKGLLRHTIDFTHQYDFHEVWAELPQLNSYMHVLPCCTCEALGVGDLVPAPYGNIYLPSTLTLKDDVKASTHETHIVLVMFGCTHTQHRRCKQPAGAMAHGVAWMSTKPHGCYCCPRDIRPIMGLALNHVLLVETARERFSKDRNHQDRALARLQVALIPG
eukprot:6465115-Amphidinium_carterae.1